MNTERELVMDSTCSPISNRRSCRYRWTDGYLNWPASIRINKIAAHRRGGLAFICFQTRSPVLHRFNNVVADQIMSSANLKIPLKSNDGSVKSLVCEFRKLVEAMEEGNDVSSEEPKLARKILGVELFKDERPAYVRWCFRTNSFPPGKNVGFYGWLQRLMRNSLGKEVGCIFTKEPCDLSKPLP